MSTPFPPGAAREGVTSSPAAFLNDLSSHSLLHGGILEPVNAPGARTHRLVGLGVVTGDLSDTVDRPTTEEVAMVIPVAERRLIGR